MLILTRYYFAMSEPGRLKELIDRIARIGGAADWADELNPVQRAVLFYLARANRFSRAPSHVADYMATTRGTASQTLKALLRKGLVSEQPSRADRRSISFWLTPQGEALSARATVLEEALSGLGRQESEELEAALENTLRDMLARRGNRPFGICHTCRHHKSDGAGAHCTLLDQPLEDEETGQICHEHQYA